MRGQALAYAFLVGLVMVVMVIINSLETAVIIFEGTGFEVILMIIIGVTGFLVIVIVITVS